MSKVVENDASDQAGGSPSAHVDASVDSRGRPFEQSRDWRIWLGLVVTIVWLLLGATYVFGSVGWNQFVTLPADQLGSFLEGAFAPLAFLWLVIGYFLQQTELEQNTEVLRAQADEFQRSVEQAKIQSEKMAQSEMHARQDTFLQIVNRVYGQLGSIGGLLYVSSQGATGDGSVSTEEFSQLFAKLSARDTEVFSRLLLETHARIEDTDRRFALFYGTEVRARHSNNFIFSFERMIRRAVEVDTDDMIRDSVSASAHGFIYSIAKRYQAQAPNDLADRKITGTHIRM